MLSWKVFKEDANCKDVVIYDIFENGRWQEEIAELMHTSKDKQDFAEKFRSKLMYQYWSRCEYEIVLTSWPPYVETNEVERLSQELAKRELEFGRPYHQNVNLRVARKIDIFDQLLLNWDQFITYVWENA